jgi:hypothetical protein
MPNVQITERELEDWLCKDKNLEKRLGLRFVARQVNTDVGRVDILGYRKSLNRFCIVELKVGPIDADAYFQAKRYHHFFSNMKSETAYARQKYPDCDDYNHKKAYREFDVLLVGASLDKKLDYSVKYWKANNYSEYCQEYGYRLFSIDFDEGLSLTYSSISQQAIADCDYK